MLARPGDENNLVTGLAFNVFAVDFFFVTVVVQESKFALRLFDHDGTVVLTSCL